MSLSKLHVHDVAMMDETIGPPRASLSRSSWYDLIRSDSSLRPLYRPAFSAGGVRYEMVAAYERRLAMVASDGLLAA